MSDPVTRMNVRDLIVNAATGWQDLIERFRQNDPEVAEQLEGKAAIYAKTYPATFLIPLCAWVVAHYQLGWDGQTLAFTVWLIGTATAWVCRTITKAPIKSLMDK